MIPEKFIGGQRLIASYDYTDIAEGTGIVSLNGMNTGLSGSATYPLIKQSIYSDDVETAINYGGYWLFNMSNFNLPRTLRGTAITSFSVSFEPGTSDTFFVTASIQKMKEGWADAVTIGSAVSELISSAGGAELHHFTLSIDLPRTHIQKGEYVRIVLQTHFHAGSAYIGHDPANRDGTHVTPAATYPTKFELMLPFEIDL